MTGLETRFTRHPRRPWTEPRGVAESSCGEREVNLASPRSMKREHASSAIVRCVDSTRLGRVLGRIPTEQLFAAKGWCIVDVRRDDDAVVVDVEPTRSTAICSDCGETKHRIHDRKPARQWRDLDGWNTTTLVRAELRRVRNRRCGVRIEQVCTGRVHTD